MFPSTVVIDPAMPAYLMIGGQQAVVSQITSLAGYAGIYQVQATVPAGAATARNDAVVFSAGSVLSKPATIAVQ